MTETFVPETAASVEPEPERAQSTAQQRFLSVASVLERYALVLLFAGALAFFVIDANGFGTAKNIRVVLGTQGPLVLFALAAIAPLVVGQFDLSVAAIGGVSSIVLATTMSRFDQSLGLAIVAALLAGALLGLINGLMVAYVGVNAFIVTLAMSTVLQGIAQWYTGGSTINTNISASLTNASIGNLGGIPKGVLWFLPAALVFWYALEHTPFGRYLRSVGSNAAAARLIGIPVSRLTMLSFVFAGVLAALGGTLLVGQSGLADPQTTLGALLLPALAAAFLGASTIRPGLFNVAGTVLAVFFVAYIVSGLSFLGAQPWVESVLDGGVLACAVTTTTLLRRRRRTA